MSCKIRLPTPLRPMAGGGAEVEAAGATVGEVLSNLDQKYKGLKRRLCDESGEIRRFINLYLNEEDVRHKNGLKTPVQNGDVISIVPAVAGGSPFTFQEKLAQLKKAQKEIDAVTLKKKLEGREKPVVIDVREADEFKKGHIPGATHISRGFLEMKVEGVVLNRETPIVVNCAGGTRSIFAAETLTNMGYSHVESLAGGFGGWAREGFPVATPPALSEDARARYDRHLSIPEVGEKGQAKLLQSKVLLIGAGGLGSPSAYYLSAAGIGTLGIVDFDVVDISNLQRQILHTTDRVGTSKIQSAIKTIKAFNPETNIIPFEEKLSSANVERIFKNFDIVLDGSDNFPTRYLVNDACVKLKKPCIHGSVYRFEGQVTVFDPAKGGPCYRCLYPEPPPPELAPSCADAGVLGVVPGVIGLLEAVEVVKLILGKGDSLVGRLLAYDALATNFREYKLRKNPDCAYCGEGKKFPGYIDYEFFCSSGSKS